MSLAALVFLAVCILFRVYILSPTFISFWDARVYSTAFRARLAHGTPYALGKQLTFVYPPPFLHLGASLYPTLQGSFAHHMFIALDFLAMLATPVLLASAYFRSRWLSPGLAIVMFTFSPAFISENSFYTGNLSNFLYPLLLLAALPGIRRGKWAGFYLVLGCFSLIKYPLLSFLLLPLFMGEGQLVASGLTATVVLITAMAGRLLDPAEYRAYMEAVKYQVFVNHDFGYGPFYYANRITQRFTALPAWLPSAAYLLVVAAAVGLLCWLRVRRWSGLMPLQSVAATLIVVLLCNPRLEGYDLDQFLIPTIYLLVELSRSQYLSRKTVLLFFIPGAFVVIGLIIVAPLTATYGSALMALAIAAVVSYQASRAAGSQLLYRTKPS